MKLVRYDGPGHVLRVAGREIPRGDEQLVPDKAAEQLLTWQRVRVRVREPEAASGEGQATDSMRGGE